MGHMQCSIERNRGTARMYPCYTLTLDIGRKFLLGARKRKKSQASAYVISLDEKVRACCASSNTLVDQCPASWAEEMHVPAPKALAFL